MDTFGGRVHVEWDPQAAVTPFGQLPFFTEFLQVSGLFDPWVNSFPLLLISPNALNTRDVFGATVLSILSGEWWVLDADTTVNPLYGYQEVAVNGYILS